MCSAPRGASTLERRRGGNRVRVAGGCCSVGMRRSLDQEGCFVVSTAESAFGAKIKDIGEQWTLGRGDEIQEVSRRRKREVQQ